MVGLALLASACSSLTPDDPAATLAAERAGMIAEATSIAQAGQSQSTQVAGTVVAAQTYVAMHEGQNRQLVATMQVAFPPTQALIDNSGPSTPGLMETPAPLGSVNDSNGSTNPTDAMQAPTPAVSDVSQGAVQFTQVGTASSVRDSDGCADALSNTFPADIQRIYITARALNIAQGTEMRVEWLYQGQLAYSESFTVQNDDDDFCLWFFIEPTETVLSPGNWSVKLYANGQSIDPPQVDFAVG
ncbi:MAG: hypothetical protein IT319_20800 [Anaerolineae bacterium]|nr:hypothetical protein [Anaerolineae bacterium]